MSDQGVPYAQAMERLKNLKPLPADLEARLLRWLREPGAPWPEDASVTDPQPTRWTRLLRADLHPRVHRTGAEPRTPLPCPCEEIGMTTRKSPDRPRESLTAGSGLASPPSTPPPPGRRCQATTQAGQPCRMTPLSAEDWCIRHSPNIPESLKTDIARLGGLAHTAPAVIGPNDPNPDLKSAETIGSYLEATAGLLLRGRITPTMAAALSNIAATAIRARELVLADEVQELQRRLLAAKVARGVQNVRGEAVR